MKLLSLPSSNMQCMAQVLEDCDPEQAEEFSEQISVTLEGLYKAMKLINC